MRNIPIFRFRKTLCLAACICVGVAAQHPIPSAIPSDLTKASLEDLANIQVTSVSRKEQKLSQTGGSVYVITQEDIRRSGLMNIPDLLRMVPGVDVARVDANAWAISIRGFNRRYSDKVLVLIDGRSVYNETYSGVYWDQLDVPLEDIDRIEVVRGPGGTVWGANAVNGVINIITKSSIDTQGGLITAGTGSEETAEGLLQYGGKIGTKGAYRAFGRYSNIESATFPGGGRSADGWHASRGGFRSDWVLSPQDTLTVQGDLFQTGEGQTVTALLANHLPDASTFNDRVTVGGGNILGRLTHKYSNGSELTLQSYYDRFHRYDAADNTEQKAAADLQVHFRIGSRQDLVTGTGYSLTNSNYVGAYFAFFVPPRRTVSLLSAFVQDEIKLTDSVRLTLGSKFEHNAFTGFEYEPSVQLVWTPRSRQTFWMSAARTIRQPSIADEDLRVDLTTFPLAGGGFGLVQLLGNRKLEAERLRDYELGYRAQVRSRVSLDATVFWSDYSDLRTLEPGLPFFTSDPGPPHLVTPLSWGNLARARNYGAELSASWDVTARWRISPSFSFLRMNVIPDSLSGDTGSAGTKGDSPAHQAQLRSSLKVTRHLEWDTSAYFVGRLNTGPVPAYTRLDTRLGWALGESVYFSVSGQNLLTPHHLELLTKEQVRSTEVERSIVGKITWHF